MAEAVKPDAKYGTSYVQALSEGLRSIQKSPEEIKWIDENFSEYLRQEEDLTNRPEWWQASALPVTLPDGRVAKRVPCTTLWLVSKDRFIGEVAVRHMLTPELAQVGGHIGYNVRKMERQKGFGSLLLQIGLKEATKLDINPVLITCNEDNLGSIKIIEKAGGKLSEKISIPGRPTLQCHYWMDPGLS